MPNVRISLVFAALIALFVLTPLAASAQTGIIAGVVRDGSGAVIPGVTIEAASPALIERVRSSTSDNAGQYKIVDLRPGSYTVTFTLTGFSVVRREGIELSAGFTANVNAELRVGALEETITVSGASPVVDVQNTRQLTTMSRDVIDSIPAAKSPQSFAVLVPGVIASTATAPSAQDVGGTVSDRLPALIVHGSRSQEMPTLYDGMRVNNMNATPGGSHLMWSQNAGAVQEYTIEVGSLSAESDASGVRQNAIPKAGGNNSHATLFGEMTGSAFQSTSNVSDPTKAFTNKTVWDLNPTFGGPLKVDKLWLFAAYRYWGTWEHPPGAYYDAHTSSTAYTPDLSRPAYNEVWSQSQDVRLTWQASPRNKFSFLGDDMERCWCHWNLSSVRTPDASTVMHSFPNLVTQMTWNAPVTNKLLIDAGYTYHPESWSSWPEPDLPWGTYARTDSLLGTSFGAFSTYVQHITRQYNGKFNVTYVTGSHAFKVGFQEMHGHRIIENWTLGQDITLGYRGGVPATLTEYAFPYNTDAVTKAYDGLFAQDQWTRSRMTLNLGVRLDILNASVPAQSYPTTPFVPARSFGAVTNAPNWKDINPRIGVAYDLFGNGKTAVKANIGRFVQAVTTAYADNVTPIVTSVNNISRSWADSNSNGLPDCDFTNMQANGECGKSNNLNFGGLGAATTYDPNFLNGWGKRPFDWEFQTGVQQELRRGVSLNVTYTRHWWGNFLVNDNLLTSPSDYSSYCVTAPSDSRLPGGGGNQLCGFYDLNPDKFGQVNNFVTYAKNFGQQSDIYNGVDVSVATRLAGGIILQGGFNTGHEVWDNCGVVGLVDNSAGALATDIARAGVNTPNLTNLQGVLSPSPLFCHDAPPFQTQVKLAGSYPLPWWNLSASAAFQSVPGTQITASYSVPVATLTQALGRAPSSGSPATVQLIAPGTMYGDRVYQLDSRLTKTWKLGRTRLQGQLNAYNLLNVGPVLGVNNTYGASWLAPTATLQGRMFKFGAQVDW
jgi:hypothetical protein